MAKRRKRKGGFWRWVTKRRRSPRKWWASVKRRRGGIYLWRTRKHSNPFRRENGYVGLTNSYARRERDHKGKTAYLREDGSVQESTEKPWMDLDAKVHKILPLPWWLCWAWVLGPLETLLILLTWPRYNIAKNGWNPRRVSKARQYAQRDARNRGDMGYRARVRAAVWGRRTVQALGVLVILTGLIGTVITHH